MKTDVAVIGGGPGGYAAAFAAADRGLNVTIVDESPRLGGTCLHRGCIPSKALLHVARLLNETRSAKAWGIDFGEPGVDIRRINAWKDEVVANMTAGLSGLQNRRGVALVQGRGSFLNERQLQVAKPDGGVQTVDFQYAIIATGSQPATLPNVPMNSPRMMDSTAALRLDDIPTKLLVIGGGYIGLELATVYDALGSNVTVVEKTESLLPGVDGDLVRPLAQRLNERLHAVHTSTQVERVKERDNDVLVTFMDDSGEKFEASYDRVLVAVGRQPRLKSLNLERTRIQRTERGFIAVDTQRRTDEPNVFAVGDVVEGPMLAHKASHEGIVAAEVISGLAVHFDARTIPAVVFTDPEIAWCGVTEEEAKRHNMDVRVVRFPWGASGRAATMGRTDGLTKMIVDRSTEHVLGVGITGPGAAELIAEGVLAVEMGAVAEDVRLSIHPHPTLSETLMEAAQGVGGLSTHVYARR